VLKGDELGGERRKGEMQIEKRRRGDKRGVKRTEEEESRGAGRTGRSR
jgi:hypothetical protein